MARAKIPEELKKLHQRNYIATYRQREKQQQKKLKDITNKSDINFETIQTTNTNPTIPTTNTIPTIKNF